MVTVAAIEALEYLPDPVLTFDCDGVLTQCNRAALVAFGYPLDGHLLLLGQSFEALLPPTIRQALAPSPFDRFCDRAMRVAPVPVKMSFLRHPRDRVEVAMAVTVAPLSVEADSGIVMIMRGLFQTAPLSGPMSFSSTPLLAPGDSDSAVAYEMAFDFAPIGLFAYDAEGVATACNEAFVGINGASRQALLGMVLNTLPSEGVRDAIEKSLRGERGRFEGAYESVASGRKSMIRAEFVPIRANDGSLHGGVGIVEDVTERRKLQARLAQTDRLASVGTLAAGVAHEINNPLASVLSHLDYAQQRIHELNEDSSLDQHGRARIDEALTNALDGAKRVQHIVRDLKIFSRGADETLSPVAIERALNAAITMATPILRGQAEIHCTIESTYLVWAEESRLAQVFLNLLLNAGQASSRSDSSNNAIDVRVYQQADGRICTEVADHGHGISPENLPRIFEPFFTTRPTGIGTGLGLSICHGIVQSLGGEITVESVLNRGSVFRVHLRAAPTTNTPQVVTHQKGPVAEDPPRLRLLVVDDETLLARSIELQLNELHDITLADSGTQALSLLAAGATFTTILCDMMLPDMSGLKLYELIQQQYASINAHFVFMTGGSFTPKVFQFLKTHSVVCLEKPFSVEQLREAIEVRRPQSHEI